VAVSDRVQSVRPSLFRGGGDVGAVLRATDWSGSALGEPTRWPDALANALAVMLASAHPMMVLWGPRLACFYNDALRASLGPEKHPRALGQPLATAFPESRELLEAELAGVLAGEGAIWRENRLIPIHRHGILPGVLSFLDQLVWTERRAKKEKGVAGIMHGVGTSLPCR